MCGCESEDCPAHENTDAASGQLVIHLLALADTVAGDSQTPAVSPGFGAIPAGTVRQMATRTRLRPVIDPTKLKAEPQYRPSAALAEFIRWRDHTTTQPRAHPDDAHPTTNPNRRPYQPNPLGTRNQPGTTSSPATSPTPTTGGSALLDFDQEAYLMKVAIPAST